MTTQHQTSALPNLKEKGNRSIKWLFAHIILFIIMFVATRSYSQKSTIHFPPASEILKIKNKEIFLSKINNINFYATVINGKIMALDARTVSGNVSLPSYYTINAKDDNQQPGTSVCTVTVCQSVTEDGDCVNPRTYEFDCADLLDIDVDRTTDPVFEPIPVKNYPTTVVTGSFSVYKKSSFEVFAVYRKGRIIKYTAKSLTGEKVVIVQWGQTTSTNLARRVCWVTITSVDKDGNRVVRRVQIDCDKLPLPSGGKKSTN